MLWICSTNIGMMNCCIKNWPSSFETIFVTNCFNRRSWSMRLNVKYCNTVCKEKKMQMIKLIWIVSMFRFYHCGHFHCLCSSLHRLHSWIAIQIRNYTIVAMEREVTQRLRWNVFLNFINDKKNVIPVLLLISFLSWG